jgi:hypothetical protein
LIIYTLNTPLLACPTSTFCIPVLLPEKSKYMFALSDHFLFPYMKKYFLSQLNGLYQTKHKQNKTETTIKMNAREDMENKEMIVYCEWE